MRISTNYIYDNTRRALQDGVSNLLHTQEIMATQKKVNHLSDDPVAVGRILNTSAMSAMQDTYTSNLANGTTFQGLYDGAFESTTSILSRAKELMVGEANSATSTPTTREAARVETGDQAFQGVGLPNGVNLFDVLQRANQALSSGNQAQIQSLLTDLDKGMAPVTSEQSIAGARQNLFTNTTNRVADIQTNLKMLLSDLSDADATQTVTDLNRQDNAFQALLGATSKVIQPSLLDFLK
jgi:flagellar hook-associated protein 3 FlgL